MVGIVQSVGRGGRNGRDDTKIVQSLLNNNLAAIRQSVPLAVDGVNGPKTVGAITTFQSSVVNLSRPDGRVDPGGKTITALLKNRGTAPVAPAATAPAAAPAPVPASPAAPTPVGKAASTSVTYKSTVGTSRRLVSDYAFRVLERALANAGMSGAVITSTMRIPSEQAAIMHRNAKKGLSAQYKLYGGNGDKVLDVYRDNKDSKTETEVKALMEAKIQSLTDAGRVVSRHCSTVSAYKNRNIIDMGVNSTRALGDSGFSITNFTTALRALETAGYIAKFIDETGKSNTCWHVEVIPNVKPIPADW